MSLLALQVVGGNGALADGVRQEDMGCGGVYAGSTPVIAAASSHSSIERIASVVATECCHRATWSSRLASNTLSSPLLVPTPCTNAHLPSPCSSARPPLVLQYIEIDIDISANAVASYVTGLVRGATRSLVIDMGFVLEGEGAAGRGYKGGPAQVQGGTTRKGIRGVGWEGIKHQKQVG